MQPRRRGHGHWARRDANAIARCRDVTAAGLEPHAMPSDALRALPAVLRSPCRRRPRASGGSSLAQVGASGALPATDCEPIACRERLELLALVRGLEAIDQPARVTLVTNSRYVNRGLKHGLAEWRADDWQWERFGQLVPVRDHDLWRRVDRALQFHELDCRMWHFDESRRREASAADVRAQQAEHGPTARGRGQGSAGDGPSRAAAAWGEALQNAGLAAG